MMVTLCSRGLGIGVGNTEGFAVGARVRPWQGKNLEGLRLGCAEGRKLGCAFGCRLCRWIRSSVVVLLVGCLDG